MASNSGGNNGGPGLLGLLAILFIGLKLGGVIGWSWWLVLAPIWGPFAVVIAFMVLVGIGVVTVNAKWGSGR